MSNNGRRIISFFNEHSNNWGNNYEKKNLFRQRIAAFSDLINRIPKDKNVVLDLGCGTGEFSLELNKLGLKVISLDLSILMLGKAKKLMKKNDFCYDVIAGDGVDLPFKRNIFDVILCSSVYEYIENQRKVWSEIRRVLKIRGEILLSFPNNCSIVRKIESFVQKKRDFFSKTRFLRWIVEKGNYLHIQNRGNTCDEVAKVMSSHGFRIMGVKYFGTPLLNSRRIPLVRRYATMTLMHAGLER